MGPLDTARTSPTVDSLRAPSTVDTPRTPPAFGAYVHVPFCRRRCDYCAFATYTDRDHLMDRYVDACRREIDAAWTDELLPPATSVFFGGGTPSRLAPDALCRILEAIPRAPGAEVTVECNPEDVDQDRLGRYVDAGVTRISLGAQSTDPAVLASLGRRHGSPHVVAAAALVAGAGLSSWNLDLIFGAAAEDDDAWQRTLDDVLSLPAPPPHVSAYALTVEPGTPLAADPERQPDDDVQAARYEEPTDEVLTAAGYGWEEVSNWARPGHDCRHNGLYWAQGDYRGIGSAAHSHSSGRRFWNVRTPDRYVAAMELGGSPLAGEEHLDDEAQEWEGLVLSLRTPRGVPASALPPVPTLEGLVDYREGRAVLTRRGRLLANEVATHLQVGGQPVSSPG